jgi:hypothetical protein
MLLIARVNLPMPLQNIAWFVIQDVSLMKESATGQCRQTVQKWIIIQGSVFSVKRNIFIIRLPRNVFILNQIFVISMMEEGNVSFARRTIFLHQGFVFALVLSQNLIIVK